MMVFCLLKFLQLLILVDRVYCWKNINSTITYSFNTTYIHNSSPITVFNVSVFHTSAAASASEVCEILPKGADYRTCIYLCAHDVRLHRIAFLQKIVLGGAYLKINPEHRNVLEKSNFMATRRRDHEMLAIMRHFDHLDTFPNDYDINANANTVCFIGNQIRLNILVTMLSFKSIQHIRLLTLSDKKSRSNFHYYTEDDWGTVEELISSIMMAKILEHFPQKSLSKIEFPLDDDVSLVDKLSRMATNCSIILLPSDYDTLFYGLPIMESFLENFLKFYSSLSITESPTFIWISDFVHDDMYYQKNDYQNMEKSSSCDNFVSFYRKKFHWYTQDTWPRHSILFPSDKDSLGFPSSYHYLAVLKEYDNFLTSTVYVGKLKVPSKISTTNNLLTASKDIIEKENLVIVITYQLFIYSETAQGLKQQLQEELNYPYVLIIPLLTYEMIDLINDYLLDISLEEEKYESGKRPPLHVVQVILTPHFPSSRIVSSLEYPLIDNTSDKFLRRVIFSYIAVQFEQEWFYKRLAHTFVGSISLLNDARSIWTFSEVQRQAVQRMYRQQIDSENAFLQQKYHNATTPKNIPDCYKTYMLRPQVHVQDPDFVDIVPTFAPCTPHMPCHSDFSPPLFITPVQSYELVFYGLCSDNRRAFLQSLLTRMTVDDITSMVRLQHPCILDNIAAPIQTTPQIALLGAFRDEKLLSRSSIVLNINNYNDSVLEMHRIMHLLGMGKCIISQRGRDKTLSSLAALQGAVYFVDTAEDAMRTLQYLFTPHPLMEREEKEGIRSDFSLKKSYPMTWQWIALTHGPYKRLADCERRSLEAYHIMHHKRQGHSRSSLSAASVTSNGDTDAKEETEEYGTYLLEKAMDKLRHRLAEVEINE